MKPRPLALASTLGLVTLALLPSETRACCGVVVSRADAPPRSDRTTVVLMRDGTRTVVSIQPDYRGPPKDFALVIPVPATVDVADVEVLSAALFDHLDRLSAPRLVEYWEEQPCEPLNSPALGIGNIGLYGHDPAATLARAEAERQAARVAELAAQVAVGEYELSIVSSTGLDPWLRDNGYNLPASAEPSLRAAGAQSMNFLVAKLDPTKANFTAEGRVKLSPLRFHYDREDFVLPIWLGGEQDLLIHILAPGTRHQLANRPNVTIPTNLDLEASTRGRFDEFHASLFDHTRERHPDAFVTEFAWAAGVGEGLSNAELLELGADVLPRWSATLGKQAWAGGPLVLLGATRVEGGVSERRVARILREHSAEIRSCYNIGLGKDPALAGELRLEFTIAASGKVESASLVAPLLAELRIEDDRVGECVVRVAQDWIFPAPRGATQAFASAVFKLFPGGGSTGLRPEQRTVEWANAFVLTRLHGRVGASERGEELVFEPAPAIAGGREAFGALESDATILEGGINTFMARYVIRHAWTGELDCAEPLRGLWGPPEPGEPLYPTVFAEPSATTTSRGAALGRFLSAASAKQLGVERVIEPPSKPVEPRAPEPQVGGPQAGATRKPAAGASGCGCSSQPTQPPAGALLALLALLGLRREPPRAKPPRAKPPR